MAPPREIAASDDEDSDFDHLDDPIDDAVDAIQDAPAPAPVQEIETQEGNQNSHDVSNVSTDLSFFQRVYDEQRAVTIAGTYIGTNITTQGQPAHKSDQSSSITDPVPASRRPPKRKIGDNVVDLTELTQVTTPRKSGAGKGKTTEGESGAPQEPGLLQQPARTYGKRKQGERAQPSPERKEEISQPSIVRIDPYDFPDDGDDDYTVPSIPKKKTKTTAKRVSQTSTSSLPAAHPNATPDHDDISFIPLPPPSEHAPSSIVQLRSYQKPISSEENPSTSSLSANAAATQRLYIAPSTLTASQKEEYRIVSLSTQGTQDNLLTQDELATQENIPPQSSLPAVPPSDPYPPQMFGDGLLYAGAGTAYKSSGDTTVPLSNLSEILRERAGDPLDAAATAVMTLTSGLGSGSLEMGTPARVRTNFTASSPDIIGGGSPGIRTSGRKRKATQSFGEDATESLGSSRLAGIREMSAEDNTDHALEVLGTHQASTILGNDQSPNQHVGEQPTDTTASSGSAKKKRGRKKKEPVEMVTEEDTILDNSFEATEFQQKEEVPEPTEPEQPPPKRRRGRPRKSDVAATQKAPRQPTPEPEAHEGDELGSTTPEAGRRRGDTNSTNTRKRKASAPIVIDDSESDGNLSDPPEEIAEAEEEPEEVQSEAEPEIPPSDEDEEQEEEEEEEAPPRKRGRPTAKTAPPPPPTKGRRGRPPKNKVVEDVSVSSAKKSGRPKSRVQVENSEDEDQDQDFKRDLEDEAGNEESNEDTRNKETTPVPDAKPSPSPEPATTKEEKEDKGVKREKEAIKPTSFLSTQGKVKYRVGLSKRSRVASLLKVVPRKQ